MGEQQQPSKTAQAAALIAGGVSSAKVIRLAHSISTMPKLDQGIHPAGQIVAKYRQHAVTRLNGLELIMLKARRGSFAGLSDDDLQEIGLRLESMAGDIQQYLLTKTAGGSHD